MSINPIHFCMLLSLIGASVSAQTISLSEATSRAAAFYAPSHHARAVGEEQPQLQLAYTAQRGSETYFYVFNNTATTPGSFVIVGGDERAREILAYGEEGLFDYDTAPEAFRWLLGQYEEQIHHAEPLSSKERHARQRAAQSTSTRTDIPKMTTTQWHLKAPYNECIPKNRGGQYFQTGCVAVAMSQIMRTHKYPDHGAGYHEYTHTPKMYGEMTFSADFENTYYDWDNMGDTYRAKYDKEAVKPTSTLIYHAGVSVDMMYDTGGSGAYPSTVPYALATYFRYNPSVTFMMREYYSDQEWDDYLYRELSAHRCVLYGGSTAAGGGHAFVLDGYDAGNDTYSVNWGYEISSASYYAYITLYGANAVKYSTSAYQYNIDQAMVLNITPDPDYHELHVISYDHYQLLDASSQAIESATVNTAQPQQFTVMANMLKLSMLPCTIELGVMAVNQETGETYFGCQDLTPVTIEDYDGDELEHAIPFSTSFILQPGTYDIFPAYREVGTTQWCKMAVPTSRGIRTLTVEGSALPVSLELPMTAAEWRTIALPFTAAVPEGLQAYAVTGLSGSELILESVSQLDQDQAYLLRGPEGTYSFTSDNSSLLTPHSSLATPHSSLPTPHSSLLIPNSSLPTVTAPNGSYVLQNHDGRIAFYQVQSAIQVPQYSAYLALPEASASLTALYFDPTDTSIHTIPHSSFLTPHSSFLTPHSSFLTPHSSFLIPTLPGFHIYRGRVIFVK